MIKKRINGKRRIVIVLMIVTLIMIGVGVLMSIRLNSLLQGYTEKQITEQARTLALLSEEQFELEIHNLESIAQSVKTNTEQIGAFLDISSFLTTICLFVFNVSGHALNRSKREYCLISLTRQ